jgi:hypothetical protein
VDFHHSARSDSDKEGSIWNTIVSAAKKAASQEWILQQNGNCLKFIDFGGFVGWDHPPEEGGNPTNCTLIVIDNTPIGELVTPYPLAC